MSFFTKIKTILKGDKLSQYDEGIDFIDQNLALRKCNDCLYRKVKTYVTQAKENEHKFLRLHANMLRLLAANDLTSLVDIILHQYRAEAQLDVITLTLIDAEYEIRRTLKNEGFKFANYPGLIFVDNRKRLRSRLSDDLLPLLGKSNEKQKEFFFPRYELLEPVSMAVLPLIRNRKLVDSLNLGSHEDERFIEGAATDFIQQFTSVMAICIENELNKERIKQLGLLDSLTGVHNRRHFDEEIKKLIMKSQSGKRPLSCLLLDIDYFKKVNDTYGHQTGDKVLKSFVTVVKKKMLRKHYLARYGGEEFVVLLPDDDCDKAQSVAEMIREAVEKESFMTLGNETLQVTVSIGVNTFIPVEEVSDLEISAEKLFRGADDAVYEAKGNGRNRVVAYVEK